MKQYMLLLILLSAATANSQYKASIVIDASKPAASISKTLHGVFFEESSHGGEGGLLIKLNSLVHLIN